MAYFVLGVRHTRAIGAAAAVLFAVAGCKGIARDLLGIYDGPSPSTASLSSERVIVRTIYRHPEKASGEPILALYLDRISFLDAGKLRSVDRLVVGSPREIQAQVEALNLALGDTLIVSTRYNGVTLSGPDPATVPGWGGYRYLEYPIASHALTSLERAR
jgi:hypothetical protein